MQPKRISCKFEIAPDPTAKVELEPFIGLFHRFIQSGALEGMLIDVANYSHVPEGPGVMLIGHDVDYAIDLRGGRAGLCAVRKRPQNESLPELLRSVLRRALGAMAAIEREGSAGLRFATGFVTLEILDRLVAPNDDATHAAVAAAVAPVLGELYGEPVELRRVHADDSRRPLTLEVRSRTSAAAAELVARLAGSAEHPARQSAWDIPVEALKKLLDENADFVLVDVREPVEFAKMNLAGLLIPLGQIAARLHELDRESHLVVHCHSGVRSGKAVEILRAAGFVNAWNVSGGLIAWSERIGSERLRR